MLSNIFLHYVLDLWFTKVLQPQARGQLHLVRYADDFICMTQYKDDAYRVMYALRERFAKFQLELHPDKTRVISFGEYEQENAKRQGRRPNTFDFLGFTHYCGISRRGYFMVCHKTSRKKFRVKCRAMKLWLKVIGHRATVKEWWPILRLKLMGHYQYYGISGNMRSLHRYYQTTRRMVFRAMNRRSQKKSMNWSGFQQYLERYPLPKPRIMHNLYTLAPVS